MSPGGDTIGHAMRGMDSDMQRTATESRLKVLVLTSTLPREENDPTPGFVLDLARRLAVACRLMILSPHAPGTPVRQTLHAIEVRRFRYLPERLERLAYGGGITENLHGNKWLYLAVPFFFCAQVLAIRRLLREGDYDVIHAHWWVPQAVSAVIATWLAGRRPPIVCTLHGADAWAFNKGPLRSLMTWVLRRCRFVCPVSTAVREALPADIGDTSRIVIAPMGVDVVREFRPVPDVRRDPARLIFVGRLVAKKGVRDLVDATAEVRQRFPGVVLDIVGDGPLRADLEARVRALGCEDSVTFHGAVAHSHLPALLSRAAVAVVPSVIAESGDREGLGLVAVEAQGCECAVVVSDTPSLRDVVRDGETGVVTRQNDPAALAAAIAGLLENPGRRAGLAAAGRESALATFDQDAVAARYAGLFREAVSGTFP